MNKEVLDFYFSLRQIFGVCPSCGEIFRLSDCKVYQKTRPAADWKEKIDCELNKLDLAEERLKQKIEEAKDAARILGRISADKAVRKIDRVFTPLKLNPNDVKVMLHPIDFIVFNGKADKCIDKIILLDKGNKTGQSLTTQNSIERNIQKHNYEWLTLRIENNGNIIEE